MENISINEVIESARKIQKFCTDTSCDSRCPFHTEGSINNAHCKFMQTSPSRLRFKEVSKWEVL